MSTQHQRMLCVILCISLASLILLASIVTDSKKTHVHRKGVVYDWECPIINRTRICFHYIKITNAPAEWASDECVIAIRSRSHLYEINQELSIGNIEEGQCVLYTCEKECPENIPYEVAGIIFVGVIFVWAAIALIKTYQPRDESVQADIELAERERLSTETS